MNILFIAPYVPTQIRVRSYNIIRELSKRHDVHMIALGDVHEDRMCGVEDLASVTTGIDVVRHSKLRGACQSLAALPTLAPMCVAFCRSARVRRAVGEALSGERFDVVHVEHLRAAHFAPSNGQAPVVFDSVDCLTGLFEQMARHGGGWTSRLLMAEEAWKLKRYEPERLRAFDRVLVTTEAERERLRKLDPSLDADVVPNGVDTDYFAPQGAERKPARVIFSGKMSYLPNAQAVLWFARNVLPALRARFSDLEFVVAGSNPPAKVRKLSEIPGILVTGHVADIRSHMDSSSIAVAPMQIAAGIQNKVLEALAMGLPTVATPIGAGTLHEGCPGVIVARSAEDMVDEISSLIGEPGLAAALGQLGREEVKRRFTWEASVRKLEEIYCEEVGVWAAKERPETRSQARIS